MSDEVSAGPATSVPRVRILLVNAAANLVRALSASAVSVVLPLFLVVLLLPEVYTVWALVFSLGAFVTYLDLGIPTSVQAIVGRTEGTTKIRQARSATLSGVLLTLVLLILSSGASVVVATGISAIFPEIPSGLRQLAQLALPILVVGQGANLVCNAVSSYFSGRQLSHIPMWILAPARVFSMAAAIGVAVSGGDIAQIALAYSAPLVLAAVTMFLLFLSHSGKALGLDSETETASVTPIGVLRYSGPLMLWNVCMLVISGLGIVIVGRVDYGAVAFYSICLIIVAALSSLESSITAPLLPEFARSWARGQKDDLKRHIGSALAYNGAALYFATAGILVVASVVMPFVLGDGGLSAGKAWIVLTFLMVGSATRLAMTPLSLAFIATRTHSKVLLPPVFEAAVNLGFSVLLGLMWGGIGVASGYLIGSVFAALVTIFWSVKRTGVVDTPAMTLLRRAVLTPFLIVIPALLSSSVVLFGGFDLVGVSVAAAAGLLVSFVLAWRLGLGSVVERVTRQLRERKNRSTAR